jgi:DNA polymerase III gamma/tau subunit
MRDALSLLEACQGHEGEINAEKIQSILGLGSRESVIRLCGAIASQDASLCLRLTDEMYADLSDFKIVLSDLIGIYRDLLVIRSIRDYASFVESYGSELEEMKKIAAQLPLETILYQAKLLEEFYISYDRIATEKKSASEILMIRLCNESVSEDPSALLSRIGKLEQAMANGSFSSGPAKKEKMAEKKTEKPSPIESYELIGEPKKETVTEESKTFSGTVKLKNLLQQEAFIKPWLEMLSFEKEGDTLYLLCGSFVQGMLVSSGAEECLLRYVREVDGEITKVRFREQDAVSVKNSPSEFEGL